jgi:hypothetical protein
MQDPVTSFQIELNAVKMEVVELNLPGAVAFRISFSSSRNPLVVARSKEFESGWTSVPEGRQKEADGVGKLIEDYFKSQIH